MDLILHNADKLFYKPLNVSFSSIFIKKNNLATEFVEKNNPSRTFVKNNLP